MDSRIDLTRTPALQPSAILDPAYLLSVLRRRAALIVFGVLVGAAGAYVLTSRLPKSYTASGSIAVAEDRMAIPELEGALRADNQPDPMPEVHTEMQALSSRQLVQEVVNQLHLDQDPEFNAALRPPGIFASLKDKLKSLLPHGNAVAPNGGADDALLGAVDRALVISQDNRSLVIGIAFTARDPAMAARFVNTLVTDYIQTRSDRRSTANQGASAVMAQRIDQVRKDIEGIELKMRNLRTSSESVGLRAGSLGQQQVEDLATAAATATQQRGEIEAQWERASALASSGSSDALASVLGSATISRLREQESQAASKVADLSMRYGSSWPPLRSAEADLAATRHQISQESSRIVNSLATQLRVARAHESDLQAQLAHARHEGVASENVQAELTQLQQDATTRRDLYRTLLERAEQTVAEPQHDQTPDVRVLSKAVIPGLPSAPNVKSATGLGGVGGGLLACALALAFTRRGSVLDAARLSTIEGVVLVGTLKGNGQLSGTSRNGIAARVAADRSCVEADVLRTVRARLGQIARRSARKVAFVGASATSSAATTAAAFARVAALDGQRVLLVDAGASTTDLTRALGGRSSKEANVLSGDADWRDAVVADSVAGLDLLLGGAHQATSTQAVGLENLLVEAQDDYDIIILVGPQARQSDAAALVRSADVTVLVVESIKGEACVIEARNDLLRLTRNPVAAILFAPA